MTPQRRCLIVERYEWDRGVDERQLQFVPKTAAAFFGSGSVERKIHVRMFLPANARQPAMERDISITREQPNGTRHTDGFPEIGAIKRSFVFFEETDQTGTYDFWWQLDRTIVAAHYGSMEWQQAQNTRLHRGRLSVIVPAPAPRITNRL